MREVVARSVYLVGFMAAGKTTVGSLLAAELELPFVDLDALVVARSGRPIADIWREAGEPRFRALEREALVAVAGRRAVVATGGGTMVERGNRELLRDTGTVLWLRVPFAVIWERCEESNDLRPLWRDQAQLRRLYQERLPAYREADYAIDVTQEEPQAVARILARIVREREERR